MGKPCASPFHQLTRQEQRHSRPRRGEHDGRRLYRCWHRRRARARPTSTSWSVIMCRIRFARAVTFPALAVSCLAIAAAHGQSATRETCPGPTEQRIAHPVGYSRDSSGAAFTATVQRCMAAMHQEMYAALSGSTGSADAAFVAAMIPHHQGAIDMASAELRYGRNEQLRRLAQEIVVTQQQEIQVMRLAMDKPLGVPISHRDRVYAAEQFSNTVSVTDPADNRLLGV